jgi:hypothetical protein
MVIYNIAMNTGKNSSLISAMTLHISDPSTLGC